MDEDEDEVARSLTDEVAATAGEEDEDRRRVFSGSLKAFKLTLVLKEGESCRGLELVLRSAGDEATSLRWQ